MTFRREVKQVDFGKNPWLTPLGSAQRHGPHLPSPAVAPHPMNFFGTLGVEPRIYMEMVKSLVHSMVRHAQRKSFCWMAKGAMRLPRLSRCRN